METYKYKETVEAGLFRLYAHNMLEDIFLSGLVRQSDSMRDLLRRFIAYYDPARSDYVTRCETWQIAMCQQTVPGDWDRLSSWPTGYLESLGVLERDNHYDWTLRNADPYLLKMLHQVVRIFFKFKGQPRNETDFEAVKFRLSRPTTVLSQDGTAHDSLCLSKTEISEIRDYLKYLIAPRSWDDLRGRYGPGASSDVKWNHEKFLSGSFVVTQTGIIDMLHLLHDASLFGKGNKPWHSFSRYGVTKIAEVPKSLKSNRIVSSEPSNSMFAQLAIFSEMYDMLNRIYDDHVKLDNTEDHVRLLRKAGYTSIDLSDASDHVSRRLVSQILPQWRSYLFSVRSTFARFPDGTLCPLRTFAPMGAGDCFSVLTATVLGICGSVCHRPFHVFGDDIICHVTDYNAVVDRLTRAGLVVNKQKSCPLGIYRESCGVEIFHKTIVTPFLMRDIPDRVDILTLEKWLSRLDEGWPGTSPWANLKRALVSAWQHVHNLQPARWSRRYQRWEMKVPVWQVRKNEFVIRGEASLRRWLTIATDDRNERPDTMETWDTDNNSKPRLLTWQQSLAGRAEQRKYNLAGHIPERRGSECMLSLSWRGTHEFPRFLTVLDGMIHQEQHTNTMEVLNDSSKDNT